MSLCELDCWPRQKDAQGLEEEGKYVKLVSGGSSQDNLLGLSAWSVPYDAVCWRMVETGCSLTQYSWDLTGLGYITGAYFSKNSLNLTC